MCGRARLASILNAALGCLLTLHAPDGSELLIETEMVRAVRAVGAHAASQVASGTRSIVYLGDAAPGLGVRETPRDIEQRIGSCRPR